MTGGGDIYLDHASTSWPKPPEVVTAVTEAVTRYGGNPGRGAYRLVIETSREIERARRDVAALLGVADPNCISFQPGDTQAMNIALLGFLKPGDRVVVSGSEHNAARRPLDRLATQGVEVVVVPTDAEGYVDLHLVEDAVAAAPTAALVFQHASNLSGAILPVADLADIAHAHGARIIVDGAQAGGHLPVKLDALGVDAWTCSGHKGLLGPVGVGVLYLAPGFEPTELVTGGGAGDSEEYLQPTELPGRYEAGTANTLGILGLGAGCRYVSAHATELWAHERTLTERLYAGLSSIEGITVLGPLAGEPRVPLVSFVHRTIDPERMSHELSRRYGIAARAGKHCTPWSHESLGTERTGALRLSVGWSSSEADVDLALVAVREIAGDLSRG